MSIAFVFPGQGSQSVGMLADLADRAEVVETFAEASEVLGYDLRQLVQEGFADDLNQTHRTQPAMLAAGVAAWRVWQAEGGGQPALMAGHSLGEYTALVCSQALDFTTAVALVEERGRLMQEAVPVGEGAMAAVLGLADEQVIAVCDASAQGDVVQAVNFNSPGQVVIAGSKAAVGRAAAAAKEAGAKRALLLPVSAPSHCDLMKPAAEKLGQLLTEIELRTPQVPVIHNVDVQSHDDVDAIRTALTDQLYRPVRWVESVQKMAGEGATILIECGPGKVLAGLTKRIEKSLVAYPFYDMATLQKAMESLKGE